MGKRYWSSSFNVSIRNMYGTTADTGFEYHFSATFTSMHELFSGKEQLLFQYKGVISRKKRDPWGP